MLTPSIYLQRALVSCQYPHFACLSFVEILTYMHLKQRMEQHGSTTSKKIG